MKYDNYDDDYDDQVDDDDDDDDDDYDVFFYDNDDILCLQTGRCVLDKCPQLQGPKGGFCRQCRIVSTNLLF